MLCVQTGAAGGAVQGCLNPRILEIYTAFAVQQLTAPTSQCNVAQVILDYFAAFARLVAALPSDQAPADLRLSRSPLWPCSQANLLPSSTDRVPPPPPDVVAVHALSPATDEDTARTGEVASQAVSVPQPSTGTTQPVPVTRAQALKVLDFLVVPPEGLVWTVLNDSSKPVEERQAALSLLTTIYQSNCCSILADADHAAYCSTFHFTAFTSAYAEKDVHLCCQHLKALHALAKHKVSPTAPMLLVTHRSIQETFSATANLQQAVLQAVVETI